MFMKPGIEERNTNKLDMHQSPGCDFPIEAD